MSRTVPKTDEKLTPDELTVVAGALRELPWMPEGPAYGILKRAMDKLDRQVRRYAPVTP